MADNLITQGGVGGPAVATSEGVAPETTVRPAGGRSNLRNVWVFKGAPFEVRTKRKAKRYKTAQAATTAVREAIRADELVEVVYQGEPVSLPATPTASYAEIYARIERAEQRAKWAADEAEAEKRLKLQRDNERALVMVLGRLWRL